MAILQKDLWTRGSVFLHAFLSSAIVFLITAMESKLDALDLVALWACYSIMDLTLALLSCKIFNFKE